MFFLDLTISSKGIIHSATSLFPNLGLNN